MSFKRTIKRFAHVSGFTFVTYSEDGEIITSGQNDGDIRIWKEISDDDPSSFCIGETATCCVQYSSSEKKLLLAASENSVQRFSFPSGDQEGILLRFSAPVTTIDVNKKWMAAGSEDFTIKVRAIKDTDEVIDITGHEGLILHVALSCKDLLASSAGDGTLRIWDLNAKTDKLVKTFDGFPKFTEFSNANVFSTPTFDKQGKFVAFAKGKSIQVVDTKNWETVSKLENSEISGHFSVCSFSHCGRFIAAGSVDGEISLWNFESKSIMKGPFSGEDKHAITSLAWNPLTDELAFCDSDGQLSSLKTSLKSKFNEDIEEEEIEEMSNAASPTNEFLMDEAEDDDNENCFSLEKMKNETLKISKDSDDEDSVSVKSRASSIRIQRFAKFDLQPPFQPGSTPSTLEHRFMIWNHVGHVISSSSDENSIIAEFHDVTIHPSLHILNSLNHEMASLSTSCLALATKETPCRLVCIALTSSGSKEWQTTMPECEEIQGIAASELFVAVATDARFVRFFSTLGTQRGIISVAGPVVTLSAMKNRLALIYHTSTTANKYTLMIITLAGFKMTSRTVEVPLLADAKLLWLGWSDLGSVVAYDSTGRVTSYDTARNFWNPICDMTNHATNPSDKFFIISVCESTQKIRATQCRGTSYPIVSSPRPFVREIDYGLPLCYMETEKSSLEEELIRAVTFQTISSEKTILEKGLKLFSSAMNSELEARAYEIVELVGDKTLIQLAFKYANQKGRVHMTDKLSKLLTDLETREDQRIALVQQVEDEIEEVLEHHEEPARKETFAESKIPVIAPKPMISQKKSNPFKKSGAKLTSTPTPSLNHLTNTSNKSINVSKLEDDENQSMNSMNQSVDTPRPGNFAQWFLANKASLLAENKEATEVELMKIGKERYQNLTRRQKGTADVTKETSISNKRKLDMSSDESGISKLTKYGFVEK